MLIALRVSRIDTGNVSRPKAAATQQGRPFVSLLWNFPNRPVNLKFVNIIRSVAAVISGYAIFAASAVLLFQVAGRDPHAPQTLAFECLAVVYGIIFAGLGGLLAAGIAPRRGTLHAAFVTVTIALGAAASLLAKPGAGATWSQWTALVLMAPSAWGAAKAFARWLPK